MQPIKPPEPEFDEVTLMDVLTEDEAVTDAEPLAAPRLAPVPWPLTDTLARRLAKDWGNHPWDTVVQMALADRLEEIELPQAARTVRTYGPVYRVFGEAQSAPRRRRQRIVRAFRQRLEDAFGPLEDLPF